MQPGDRRLHWLPIAVDGTSRHEASYVHCTLGGTASPNQPSSWFLLGSSEKWETLYTASQEIDFDDEMRKAATVSFKDTGGNNRQSLFFVCRWESTGAHINGTRDLVVQLTGKAPATVARTMLQSVLDEARLAARTCTRASLNNDKANTKGKVRRECAAAIHFMRNRGWEKIIDVCLQQRSVRQHQVGGKSWELVYKTC